VLLIPLLGPWCALPVLVTGAVTLLLGTILNTPPTPLGAAVINLANLIVILGLA
jgi:hypothetical protein